MKKYLTCLLMFFFFITYAQFEKGTIYLKDGKTKEGLIKKRKVGIKFKENKDSEIIVYDYNHITGYDTNIGYYRYKNEYNASPILVELLTRGKINLYSLQKSGSGFPISGGGATFGGGTYTTYFIEKGERYMKLGNKINKGNLFYFYDCPLLIKKIKSKELHRKNVYKVIDFYNTNCNKN